MVANASKVHAVSATVRDEWSRLGRRRIEMNHLGVPDPYARGGFPEVMHARRRRNAVQETLFAINVAFHSPVKGVDVLLLALSKARRQYGVDLHLLQLGGGTAEETRRLRGLAQELGIQDHVSWLGRKDDVAYWLEQADCYVQASRSEGLPLAIIEAQMAGLPVIATDVGGVKEVVNDKSGVLVPSEDVAGLAAALASMCRRSTESREAIGISGRSEAMRTFRLSACVNRLLQDYP